MLSGLCGQRGTMNMTKQRASAKAELWPKGAFCTSKNVWSASLAHLKKNMNKGREHSPDFYSATSNGLLKAFVCC